MSADKPGNALAGCTPVPMDGAMGTKPTRRGTGIGTALAGGCCGIGPDHIAALATVLAQTGETR